MKKKAGKILLCFLVLMVCCTVIARAASSVTTAKVKTISADKGVLTQTVEGSGTIISDEEHNQSLPDNQKIKEILVKPQAGVEEGQGLVQLDMDYLAEKTEEAGRKVEKLELQLQQQKTEGQADARTPETAQAQIALNAAEDMLNQAQAAYDQAVSEYNALAENPPQSTSANPTSTNSTSANTTSADAGDADSGTSGESQGETEEESKESKGGTGSGSGDDTGASASADKTQQWEQELEAAKQKVNSANEALEGQAIAYNQAVEQYNLAVRNEENLQKNQEKQNKANAISLQSLQVDIDAAKDELQKLTDMKEAKGIVTAQFSGIFQSAGVSVGAVTTGTEQITIASGERVVKGLLSSEDAGKIQEGDKIDVTLSGQTKSVQAEVTRLEMTAGQTGQGTESEDGGEISSMVWYGKPEGEMNKVPLGTGFTYVFTKESSSYEQVIPLSALREEQGKNYVLTAETRDGILGETYTAVSVPVTVLGKDEGNAAVKGVLERNSLIIISSSKYVEEGDSVRLE